VLKPVPHLKRLVDGGVLIRDDEAHYYVFA